MLISLKKMEVTEFIFRNKRFRSTFKKSKLEKLKNKFRVVPYPYYSPEIINFFERFAKQKYKLQKNPCLCGNDNDVLLSLADRNCVKFTTVFCKSCGLIRAKDYYRNEDIEDFYEKFYRSFYINTEPSDLYEEQKKASPYWWLAET